MEHIDILHMNEDELSMMTGCEIEGTFEDDHAMANAIDLFLRCGVAVVIVTLGRKGSFVKCNDVDRFRRSSMLPASWADCTAKVGCVELPDGAVLNGNGASDSFTSGFLVAAMLRHTGMTVSTINQEDRAQKSDDSRNHKSSRGAKGKKKKLTPYTLYMRENYVSLKTQLNDDKKAIFSKCHEMWENESDEVKALYERRALEENEEDSPNEMSLKVMDALEDLDATPKVDTSYQHESIENVSSPRNLYMTNRSLNLESAVQFASLVAAYHIDVSTRDRPHIDVSQLVERSLVVSVSVDSRQS